MVSSSCITAIRQSHEQPAWERTSSLLGGVRLKGFISLRRSTEPATAFVAAPWAWYV
jgi:hypothetical protein